MLETLSALVLLAVMQTSGDEIPCDEADVAAAEQLLESAHSWSAIQQSINKYPGCDDAHIAEEYSDRIVHLLATRWTTLPSLNKLVTHDDGFRSFILRHIDATADLDELQAVARHAGRQCPKAASELCKDIGAAATAAAKDAQ